MEHIDILNDLRPWDCEQFPKSKNICFGGGGGNPIQKVLDPVAKGVSKVGGEVAGGLSQGMDAVGKVTEITPNIPKLPTPNIPTPNLDFVNEGISHNLGEFGKGMNAIGDVVMHNVKQIENIPKLFQGGSAKQGAMGGAGAMGPASGGLARLGASKLQMKKAGMGRRQTYLTKG